MPHQCTHCGKLYPDAAEELLNGCDCGGKFFYYIRQQKADEIERGEHNEIKQAISELDKADKVQIEKDIRDITGLKEEPDKPVILDLESVRVIKPSRTSVKSGKLEAMNPKEAQKLIVNFPNDPRVLAYRKSQNL